MSTQTNAAESNVFASFINSLKSVPGKLSEAAPSAGETAKELLIKGAYKAAYGISYGAVYATIFVTELLPKNHIIRRGFEEGADAAFKARDEKKTAPKKPSATAKTPKKKAKSKA